MLAQPDKLSSDDRIAAHARLLSGQLLSIRDKLFPPELVKTLRSFTSGAAARLIGVSDSHLLQISSEGLGPLPEVSAIGRRSYVVPYHLTLDSFGTEKSCHAVAGMIMLSATRQSVAVAARPIRVRG